jgi:hypothetical protein
MVPFPTEEDQSQPLTPTVDSPSQHLIHDVATHIDPKQLPLSSFNVEEIVETVLNAVVDVLEGQSE